jgi:tetratricopeptide (TPR) repeat protein
LQRNDKDVDVLTNLGVVLHGRGMYEEAIGYYRRAEEIDPDDPVLHANCGRALYDLGRFDEAIGSFKRARELDPEDAEVQRLLGLALHGRGDVEGALKSYTAATEQDSANALAHLDLSGLLAATGKYEEAREQAERSLSAFGQQGDDLGEAWAYGALAWSQYCLGDFENSVQACRKALETDPGLVHVRFHLAVALLQLGNENEARAEYQAAMHKSQPADLKAHGIDVLEQALRDRPDLPDAGDILRMLKDKYDSFEVTAALGRKSEAGGGA